MKIQSSGLKSARSTMKGMGGVLAKAQMRAVNKAASTARTEGSKAIRDDVRLSAKYVNQNLVIKDKATRQKHKAIVSGRVRPTRLARYGAKQLTRKAKTSAAGDPVRGIPAGRKQAGVSVAVSKSGRRKKMRNAFLVPLRSAGNMGVFIRTGSGKNNIKHLYGPSVSQVFTDVRETIEPTALFEMSREFRRQIRLELTRRGQ